MRISCILCEDFLASFRPLTHPVFLNVSGFNVHLQDVLARGCKCTIGDKVQLQSYAQRIQDLKSGIHVIVSVVRIVSAPANDRDDHMEMHFVAIQTILATETTRSSG